MQPTRKVNPAIATLIVIVLVGIIAAVVVVARNQSEDSNVTETTTTQEAQTDTTNTPSESSTDATYQDGTYTETGSYISPGGRESIDVTLTVADDVITDASVTSNATSGEAKEYQAEFISGYKTLVVGKDIDEVNLTRVAGSSLTSNGFNAAVELIKADAQA